MINRTKPVNNVFLEHQFNSYGSDLSTIDNLDTADTITVDGERYSVSQVESINWCGGASWQSLALADVWHVKLLNGVSLNVVPTQLDHESWDTLANLAFPK